MHNLFIFAISIYLIASVALSCVFTSKWDILVKSAIPDDIVVHIKSGDDDLGNHTIPFVGNYSWSFCENFGGNTLFYGYFWWGSRFQSLALFDNTISNICFLNVTIEHCYWIVRPDGFYVKALPSGPGELIKTWG